MLDRRVTPRRSSNVPGAQDSHAKRARHPATPMRGNHLDPSASEDAPRLDIVLLGRFAVSVDSAEIASASWPSLRAMHLVQLLSLQARYRMHRDLVIDALWPKLESDAGAANLRKALHHARQALGRPDAIVLQRGELVLWPGGLVNLDVHAFEHAARLALQLAQCDACAEADRHYTGDLLPGVRYEDWTEPDRQRLRALHVELLRGSAQWESLVQIEPTDEGAHRALMQREIGAGNQAAALRWYAHLREALQNALGVLPQAQTEALHERCLAGLRVAGPAWVGRVQELGAIMAWLGMDRARRPGAMAVRGPAGIGKSALCRETAARARAQGWTVLRVDASDAGGSYGVITSIAEHFILEDRAVLERVGAPARGVLALLSPLATPADAPLGPPGRHQVVGAIRRLLLAAASGTDILLQVDDAHLMDDADVDVLTQLAMAAGPLCTLLAYRPLAPACALGRSVSRLNRAGVLHTIELDALDRDECARLIRHALPAPLSDDAVTHLAHVAAGIPFAAIELARSANAPGSPGLPGTVARAITDRLCDVAPDTLSLLGWLALHEGELDASTVEALAQAADVTAPTALDHALDAGVLAQSGSRYRFHHELVRQALIEQLPPHHRVKMHREIAARLAQTGASPVCVARHWVHGGKPLEAIPWQLAAAGQALRLAAFHDALRHVEPVLSIAPDDAQALRLRAEALDALGDPGAVAAYRLAARVADELESHNLRAKGALAQIKQGDPRGALLALQGVHPTSVEGRLCEALAYSGAAALGAADPAMGTAKAALARKLAIESGDAASLVIASWAQAAAAHARGELHRSVWADLHETSHLPQLALRVFDGHLCITQRFLYGARPYAEVVVFAQAIAAQARSLGAARGQAFGATLHGEALWLAGDAESARLQLREGARLHRAIGASVGEALSLQRLAEVALHQGQRHEAGALIDEALDLARQTDVGFHLLDRIYGTRISLHRNDPEAALHAMEDAAESVRGPLETCPGCRITFAVPAAIAAARAGRLDLADQYETQCAYLADVVMRLPAWYAAHQEVRGHIATARGARTDEAARQFAAAALQFRQAGQALDAQRCDALARHT